MHPLRSGFMVGVLIAAATGCSASNPALGPAGPATPAAAAPRDPLPQAPARAGVHRSAADRAIDHPAGCACSPARPGQVRLDRLLGRGCVGRYDLDTGAVTDAIGYPSSTQLGLLLGPYPVVFTFPSGGHVHLDRVG